MVPATGADGGGYDPQTSLRPPQAAQLPAAATSGRVGLSEEAWRCGWREDVPRRGRLTELIALEREGAILPRLQLFLKTW